LQQRYNFLYIPYCAGRRESEAMYFLVRVKPHDIDFVNKIIEGYEGLGIVTTVDAALGVVRVYVSPDTKEDVRIILEDMPVPLQIEEFHS